MSRRWSRSPSQITTYERCPKAFEFQYLKKVKVQLSWAIKGRAQHAALAHTFRPKIDSGLDAPLADVLEVFHEEIRAALSPMGQAERGEAVFFEGESEAQVRKVGEAQLRAYMAEIAPTIQPLMVEEPLEMTTPNGLRLKGILDCVDDTLTIRDAKFPTDKMRADTLHFQNQPPLYAAMLQAKTGQWPRFRFDVVASGRAKEPKPTVQTDLNFQVMPLLAAARIADVETVDAAINAGYFPRRPSEMNCSKCPFKHACWWGMLPPKETGDLQPALQASLDALHA